MGLLLTFLLGTLCISFLCSILESVLMSTPLSFITMKKEQGYKLADKFLDYKTDTEKPLAAILSLNTIANTIGAAGVGRQATILFGSTWFGIISAITTLLILIFAEIVPKTIGTSYWKNLMGFTTRSISVLIVLMYPLVLLVSLIARIMSTGEEDEASVSREEVTAMANIGVEEGVIDSDENIIYASDQKSTVIYDANAARMMTDVMQTVMESGTGKKLKLSGMPCAGKTGTTNSRKDGWFVGYTRYYTTSVWVGRDLPKEVKEFPGRLLLMVEDGAARQILQYLHIPAVFHSILHADTVTLVHHAILIKHDASGHMVHIDGQRCIGLARTFREPVHFLTLASQPAQRQVMHHHDGSCRLTLLLDAFIDDALPVGLLYATLHSQFMVEVGILVPEKADTADGSCQQAEL